MTIKTDHTLKNYNGEDIINNDELVKTGDCLANILTQAETDQKMKVYELGKKFVQNEEVELDTTDANLVKELIEKNKVYNNLVSGQLLELFYN